MFKSFIKKLIKNLDSWYLWGLIGFILFLIYYPYDRVIPRYAN